MLISILVCMNKLALINGILLNAAEQSPETALLITDDRIDGVISKTEIPSEYTIWDARGHYISPGFIDLQIYGGGGVLFAEKPADESLRTMADALVQSGTTGFYLTLATNTLDVLKKSIEVAKEAVHPAFMGLHFEGPFLHPEKRGAHPTSCLLRPDMETFRDLLEHASGTIKMMTIAPELFNPEQITYLRDAGVLLSAGHSTANYEEATQGFAAGIAAVTHLFNAMSPLHHRESGLPGAVFLSEHVCASIIVDGIHLSYETVAISKKIMGDRLFLITDAVAPATSGTYHHRLNSDHYVLPDGTLSGSALTMMDAVKNAVRHAGIPLPEAIRMATSYPARLIGAKDQGQISAGHLANLTLFDSDFQVQHVFLHGIKQR